VSIGRQSNNHHHVTHSSAAYATVASLLQHLPFTPLSMKSGAAIKRFSSIRAACKPLEWHPHTLSSVMEAGRRSLAEKMSASLTVAAGVWMSFCSRKNSSLVYHALSCEACSRQRGQQSNQASTQLMEWMGLGTCTACEEMQGTV
jgi:hypothetical protein